MKKKKSAPAFWQELCHDWNTLKKLPAKKRLQFIWDYYKWRLIVCSFALFIICTVIHMLYEGQKPCRLRVCVVLNTEDDCSSWFRSFTKELQKDGRPGEIDINLDQPFDYDNQYYYVQEIEVMTTVSSGRMDIAICGEDMYSYLLALNACMPLDKGLSKDLAQALSSQGRLVYDTANLTIDENGNTNPEDGINGFFAIDLTGTEFEQTYNQTEDEDAPLYAVVISNTEHLADCETLLKALLHLP